ncbi:2,3-bisphosphoglycerate-independent phosphoglycerate mutase [Methanoregula sp.]|uniref:2,3-bisphosphoglycerate-independent phosphoglycerate mutase n=1 Tax=Methanoregula sp. TaxID=2052170 RepID=UPI002B76ABF0|nr:2,3-bisphosphoglycerate-independent phosphoglycerate mutase [Methanoregula sp.]HVP96246.1 2,3-bisphosphoglycerate-independent phosphoglycerate mutase [Methanoregula sp.]
MTARRILFIVIDGLSDRPCPELGGRTPLEAAHHPVLNRLAAEGICGIMDTIAAGVRPGSDTAHLALLGYDPHTYYTGRGPLECAGSGIRMEPGMIGFRCNYATLSPAGLVTDRRAGRIADTKSLSRAVQEGVDLSGFGVEFVFRSGAGHRAALALKGEGLGHCVSSNDPKKDHAAPLAIVPVRDRVQDRKTAEVCNEFVRQSQRILVEHPVNRERLARGENPANIVLMRGAGEMGNFEPFSKKYGMEGSVIAAARLIAGIGSAVGLEEIPVDGITGSQESNLDGKIAAAVRELARKEFVLVNIKGADESGHDGLVAQKKAFIERADAALAPLTSLRDCLIVVCADHSTPCAIRDHSADPVPVLIHGDGVRVDDVTEFGERTCARGGLCRITGAGLLPIALDLVNRAHKYGA